jgi:hypothetical protein
VRVVGPVAYNCGFVWEIEEVRGLFAQSQRQDEVVAAAFTSSNIIDHSHQGG